MSLDQVQKLVTSFMEELQPFVESVENDTLPITQDNYGKYLEMLSGFEGKGFQFIAAIALIRCGASENGVVAALKLLNQEMGFKLELMVVEKRVMQ